MKITRREIPILFISFLIILCISFCGPGASEKYSKETVYIGSVLDLTGPAASFGEMQKQGLQMALDQINSPDNPCNYRVELIIEDSRLDPKNAINAVTKLINQKKVSAITSITGSSMALTVAPIANRSGIPILDSLSSAPSLTTDGGPYYFRIQPSDFYAGKYLIKWISRSFNFKKGAIIYAESDWGQGLREAILKASTSFDIEIVENQPAKPGDVDFRALILKIKKSKPEFLILVAHPQEAGLIIKQMAEIGYKVPTFGSDSLSTQEVKTAAGDKLDGVMFCLSASGQGTTLEEFRKKFVDKYGTQASVNSIKAYDGLMIIYHVICSTGKNAKDIYEGLKALKDYKAVSGVVSFDENGDIVNPEYDRFVYEGNKYVKMK